jgi:signal transduction histidine kinase
LRLGRQVQELNPIVVNAIDMMRRQFEKDGVVLLEDLDADLPQIEVWAGQIQVVLFNLLQNSREALLRGGVDGIVQVRTYWREPWVVLEVEDDGPGVAEPQRQHIFDASFSAKEGELGAGLGLGVCRDIARDHGGQMKLLGEPPEVCMAL